MVSGLGFCSPFFSAGSVGFWGISGSGYGGFGSPVLVSFTDPLPGCPSSLTDRQGLDAQLASHKFRF